MPTIVFTTFFVFALLLAEETFIWRNTIVKPYMSELVKYKRFLNRIIH